MEHTIAWTAALHNLGCKVNAYETEAMQQLLEEAGFQIVSFEEEADVYIINTCSVTNMADRKSRQMLHRARKTNPSAVIVAAGCYVQTALEKTGLPVEADLLIGNNRKKELVPELKRLLEMRKKQEDKSGPWGAEPVRNVTDINRDRLYERLCITRTAEHTRAFIKVQDGCNQFCSYCIIPYARGRVRSRDRADVLKEIHMLAENGIREVVLTGIHLSSYGIDCGDSLLNLIREAADVPGIARIRLGSLEPGIVTEEFADGLASVPAVCPHFHLSLQSGSDTVLARMRRRYTTEEFEQRCRILRTAFDHPALTTDIITGFPGETPEEHACTVEFLKKIRFYETHIFKYSKREGTLAASMKGQVSEQVKNERSRELISLGKQTKELYEKEWDGRQAEVLFEEPECIDGRNGYAGYTREYIRVFADTQEDLSNRIRTGILHAGPVCRLQIGD